MDLVQRMKVKVTFGKIATTTMRISLMEGSHSTQIDAPFDIYKKNIKHNGRSLQSDENIHEVQFITSIQKVKAVEDFSDQSQCFCLIFVYNCLEFPKVLFSLYTTP